MQGKPALRGENFSTLCPNLRVMPACCASIARRLAFSSVFPVARSFPPYCTFLLYSKRFLHPSAARSEAGSSPSPGPSTSRSRSWASMYRFAVERPPSYRIQGGFFSLPKGSSSVASRPPFSSKPECLSTSRSDSGLGSLNSRSALVTVCSSQTAPSSLLVTSKLHAPSPNCEAETGKILSNSEDNAEIAAQSENTSKARHNQSVEHSPSPQHVTHVETCSKEDESSDLLLGKANTKFPCGRFSMKISSDTTNGGVRSRTERKRKGALNIQNEVPDLLAVPGIGPRNFEKLVAKGIGKVAELKQLYRDKFLNDESIKMVQYLQSSVGIVHKNHAESITSFVKNCVDEEQKEQLSVDKENCTRQKKVTICVEGNISVGKSTFLQKIANEIIELRDLVEIVPEPVDKWKDVGPDHFNLLDAFYNEPERYAYTFQNYVFATRLMKEQETSKGIKPLRLMERSIFSDRLVFVRAVHEAKWMSELELRIYESWFDPFISALPGLVPDGFIYLRASPDTCLQRLHMRNRPEERSVTLDYLQGLHEKHEQCFFPSKSVGGIYSVNCLPTGPHKVLPPPRIRDQVFYLEGDHLHSSIRKVPALILDCEASIDFNRDLEAKAEYAQQVAEFYEYIRSNKDLDMNETAPCGPTNPFLLPYAGGLLKPDGSPFLHGHHLDAFNFGRCQPAFVN